MTLVWETNPAVRQSALALLRTAVTPVRDEIVTAWIQDSEHWFEKDGFPLCVTAWACVLRSRGFDHLTDRVVPLVEEALNLR
jgi:hypothetical protein